MKLFRNTALLAAAGTLLHLPVGAQTASTGTDASQAEDRLVQVLIKKGVLNSDEAKEIEAESNAETNTAAEPPPSIWKISNSFKSIQLFGDVRLRYEYRGVDNIPGASPSTYYRERFRYALRFGIRGDLVDNFNYGIRLETGTWARSPWLTFGNNGTAGSSSPSDKTGDSLNIGQLYLGWHPESWLQITAGRMPQPLYTTSLLWSPNLNPEGAFEKVDYELGNADVFADFGQFDYQDPTEATDFPSSDLFMLAWQLGIKQAISDNMSYEIAPVLYNYTGTGSGANGLGHPFVGQGNAAGVNIGVPGVTGNTGLNTILYNQEGVNNLLVLEVPEEFDLKLNNDFFGPLQLRAFGDFAINLDGVERAKNAYNTNIPAFPGLSGPAIGQNKAYQVGLGIGNAGPLYGPMQGLVFGTTSKKNTWEARCYWQSIEQYAVDPNLTDVDFFDGAANLQGVYVAFAYSITDCIIGTIRYGHASRIDTKLGTANSGLDIPSINPLNNFNIAQADLTWRF